jgi:hypothetical protein
MALDAFQAQAEKVAKVAINLLSLCHNVPPDGKSTASPVGKWISKDRRCKTLTNTCEATVLSRVVVLLLVIGANSTIPRDAKHVTAARAQVICSRLP